MKRIVILFLPVLFLGACVSGGGADDPAVQRVDEATFSKELAAAENAILLDVRTPAEYNAGHLEDAVNINWHDEDFIKQCEEAMAKDQPVFVYCGSGNRSAKAAKALAGNGYTNLYDMAGGFNTWKAKGMPYE